MPTVAEIVKRDIGRIDRATLGLTIIPRAQEALMAGEQPLQAVAGQLAGNRKFALVLLTDRRVLIVRGGLTMGAEDLPLEQITAVSTSLTKLTIATGGRQEVDVRAVSKPEEIASAIRQAISQAGVAGSDSHASAQPDVYDQLRKLGELRDAGVLTTEEFEEKKANLLGQI